MALEDLAMFRAIPTCTVFYPSDAVSAERAVEMSANTKVGTSNLWFSYWYEGNRIQPVHLFQGVCFIRTSRPETAVIYAPDEKFEVGVAKVLVNAMCIDANPQYTAPVD